MGVCAHECRYLQRLRDSEPLGWSYRQLGATRHEGFELRLSGEQHMPLMAGPSPLFRQSGTVVLFALFNVCLPLEGSNLPRVIPLKKTDSPSQKLSIDNTPRPVRGGTGCPSSFSMLGSYLAWDCTGLIHAVMTAMSSYMQMTSHLENISL